MDSKMFWTTAQARQNGLSQQSQTNDTGGEPVEQTQETQTWSGVVNRCRSCGEKFRVSNEAIAYAWADCAKMAVENGDPQPEILDAINVIEFCLECVSGPVPGEKDGLA